MPPLQERVVGAAFSPGHVSGFFEAHDKDRDPAKRGSRGAGFSVDLGARVYVELEPAEEQSVRVFLNGEEDPAPVTTRAVALVLQEAAAQGHLAYDRDAPKGERAKVTAAVHVQQDLPVGVGFGMSAAGALAGALATARAFRLGRSDGARAAHVAEVEHRTGLGDVVGALHGGFEMRVRPGLPPWGDLRSFMGYDEVVLCVVGEPLSTKGVLSDPARRERVRAAGKRAVDAFTEEPNIENFCALGYRFADETGLLTDAVRRAVDDASAHGVGSMVMLGNSVFAFGRTADLQDVLKPHGETFVAGIDYTGARFLQVETQ